MYLLVTVLRGNIKAESKKLQPSQLPSTESLGSFPHSALGVTAETPKTSEVPSTRVKETGSSSDNFYNRLFKE